MLYISYNKINNCFNMLCYKAIPSGCLVSGPDDFQIRIREGGLGHYIIMPFSDEMCKIFAIFHNFTDLLLHLE